MMNRFFLPFRFLVRKPARIFIGTLVVAAAVALSACQGALPASLSQLTGQSAPAAAPTPTYQTAIVRRGDIGLSAAGSGTVTTANSVDLSFTGSGTVNQINVQVGDQVKQGQVLATLNNLEQLKLGVSNAQLAVQVAQKALSDYQASAANNLAQAQANQASAQAALVTAQQNVHTKGQPRCDPSLTQQYYFDLLYAQQAVDYWQGQLNNPKTGYGHDYILQNLKPLIARRDQAEANYNFCQGYTDQEIAQSQANLQTAQANLQQAQTTYQTLQGHQGIDPTTLQIDQAAVTSAQLQVTKAQNALVGAQITAPIAGVVTAIKGQVGQQPPSGAFLTIADLSHPQLTVNIDETDIDNFQVGCPVQASFASLPGQTFTGKVTQVAPSLATVQGVAEVQGIVTLDKTGTAGQATLPLGLPATVQVTCQQANNVLIAPLQAIHQQGSQSYVYVLNAAGQPVKRNVVVGIESSAFAEIKSGLSQGEQVITSNVQ